DAYLPDKLEKQVAALQADPEAGGAYSNHVVTDANFQPIRPPRYGPAPFEMAEVLTFLCWTVVGAVLLRRAALGEDLRFDPNLTRGEDQDFFYRCARRFRFVYVPMVASRYRQWPGQTTARIKADAATENGFRHKNLLLDRRALRNAWSAQALADARAAASRRRVGPTVAALIRFLVTARNPVRAWNALRVIAFHR
ncbi:MAG TPA: hypothetical protein VHN99_09095, partial [Deinococcales bacterium]|nr:hypothetical protein [Deinococcales bacterium]